MNQDLAHVAPTIPVLPPVPCHPGTEPQAPWLLKPRARQGADGCQHLWEFLPQGRLGCYHCGWSRDAILARAQAQAARATPRQAVP